MIESDSLDRITINSNDILTFENNYYNHKNDNKLEKNIIRLFNSYLLSQNQNGGNNNNLSSQIKKRLYKKIVELGKNFIEGGSYWEIVQNRVYKPKIEPKVTEEKKPKIEPKVTEEKKPKIEPKVTEEKKPKIEPKVTEEKTWFDIAGNLVTTAALKTGIIDDENIKIKIKDKILRNEKKIIDNILESLSRVIDKYIKDSHMTGLKHILKNFSKNNTKDDKEWLLNEITIWINNNKKKIIDQINKYILEFIESKQPQPPPQQQPQQPQPPPQQQQPPQPAPSVFDIINNQRKIEAAKQEYFNSFFWKT
jgi:hypothetical protein